MFGNKLEGDPPRVVDSNGVIEEFEIAHNKGIKVLPLGFTEFVARRLYDQVKGAFATYYPKATANFRQAFDLLGDSTRPLNQQLQTTVDALIELRKM